MLYLLSLARQFPSIANRWQQFEAKAVSGDERRPRTRRRVDHSTCRTVLIITVLVLAAMWQAVFGTLISHFIKTPAEILGTPAQTQELPNSTVIGYLEVGNEIFEL